MTKAATSRAALACACCVAALAVGCAAERTIVPATRNPRVVSLAPSLTEIAFAVGCGSQLIGDTVYDDYPAQAKRLPHVADLVHADLERLAQVSPTTILALHDQEREGQQITARLGIPVSYMPNRRLSDLFADITGVGKACGRADNAARLSAALARRIAAVAARTRKVAKRPRVLYLLGLPGYTTGKSSYITDLLDAAGAVNVAATIDQPYPNLSAEQIVALDPDVLIVSNSVQFDAAVRQQPPWSELRAVKAGHILRPPNDDTLERNGPRVVDGLEWLARALHGRRG